MSPNKKVVEAYLATKDKSMLTSLLSDDVEWIEWADGVPPSGAVKRGKAEYIGNYGDEQLDDELIRLTEEGDVVIAEGIARVTKKDGQKFNVRYVDIFELERGKIKRKSSFGALLKDA